ncbi:MAG: LLM class flavin-dependent oxidoreductase [Acidimicrobiales bacterium]
MFAAFRGEVLFHHEGPSWKPPLFPAIWSPGPIKAPNPPIDVAAVNPWTICMAVEVADGIHVYPLNTQINLERTVLPKMRAAASGSVRALGDLEPIIPTFAAPGSTPDAIHRWREIARMQVAFYGSTPNCAFIFDQIGRGNTTARVRECQKAGDTAGMAAVIDHNLLDHICVIGTGRRWPTGSSAAFKVLPPALSPTLPECRGPATRARSGLGVSWHLPKGMGDSLRVV